MTSARAILFGFIILVSGLANSAYSAAAADAVAPADRDKVLGAGDTVTLEILEDKAPPVSRRVTDTGDLDVPWIGRIHVAGKNCSEVAAEVTRMLEGKFDHKATVKLGIDQISPVKPGMAAKVFISGDVKVPGAQEIPPGDTLTVSGAIVRAGDGTQFADLRKVQLTRKMKDGTSKTYTIDVKSILQNGQMDKDMQLQDGDYIRVPRRLITF